MRLDGLTASMDADEDADAQGFSWALAEVGERVGLNQHYTRAFGEAAAAAAEADRAAANATAALEKLLTLGSDSDGDSSLGSFSDEDLDAGLSDLDELTDDEEGFKVVMDWTPRTVETPSG